MNKFILPIGPVLKKTATFTALLGMSMLLMQFVWSVSEPAGAETRLPAEKINLALRRTAHLLLKETGDSTSRIPPVERTGDRIWLLRLEHAFDYDRLPDILRSSFRVHRIVSGYDVAVLRCGDGTLLLGYNSPDVSDNKNATCTGRELPPDCYNLQVTFTKGEEKQAGLPLAGWFFSSVLAVTLYGLRRKWNRTAEKIQPVRPDEPVWLHFGRSRLDTANQLLVCGSASHQLTYREAKLLNLFVQRLNQVLERSFILENVWADEGVLVGRSVDMFVSRLRKMLRDDPSVHLVAIHGVGYRMEVS